MNRCFVNNHSTDALIFSLWGCVCICMWMSTNTHIDVHKSYIWEELWINRSRCELPKVGGFSELHRLYYMLLSVTSSTWSQLAAYNLFQMFRRQTAPLGIFRCGVNGECSDYEIFTHCSTKSEIQTHNLTLKKVCAISLRKIKSPKLIIWMVTHQKFIWVARDIKFYVNFIDVTYLFITTCY